MRSNHFVHCLVAMAATIALLVLFGVNAATLVYLAAVLVCPLMMVFMMRGMMGGDSHAGGNHPDHQPNPSATASCVAGTERSTSPRRPAPGRAHP